MGIARQTLRQHIDRARAKGYVVGVPYRMAVGEGMELGRYTAQQNANGEVTQTWAKPTVTQRVMDGMIDALAARTPECRKIPQPKKRGDDMGEIVIGDPHAGMYAWRGETDGDYDLSIFKERHISAVAELLGRAGNLSRIVVAVLGDLFHADNKAGKTERSGNILDMDGRYGLILDTVTDTMQSIVEMADGSASEIDLVMIPGNHDPHLTIAFQRICEAWCRKCGHITVHKFDRNRWYLQHGKNALGYFHDDKLPAERLQQIMAAEQPRLWYETQHRHWRCGHFHQSKKLVPSWDVAEAPGVDVEYFRVLAGQEAYAAEAGHMSRRSMSMVIHDIEQGEIARFQAYR